MGMYSHIQNNQSKLYRYDKWGFSFCSSKIQLSVSDRIYSCCVLVSPNLNKNGIRDPFRFNDTRFGFHVLIFYSTCWPATYIFIYICIFSLHRFDTTPLPPPPSSWHLLQNQWYYFLYERWSTDPTKVCDISVFITYFPLGPVRIQIIHPIRIDAFSCETN